MLECSIVEKSFRIQLRHIKRFNDAKSTFKIIVVLTRFCFERIIFSTRKNLYIFVNRIVSVHSLIENDCYAINLYNHSFHNKMTNKRVRPFQGGWRGLHL